jgi:hypothetical protein
MLLLGTCVVHAQQLTLERVVTLAGKVESLAPGTLVIMDEEGRRHEFQIAEKGEDAVPLKKAGLLLRLPAEVRVLGTFSTTALTPGSLVRFQGRVNRAGQSEGTISELSLLEDTTESTRVQAEAEPKSSREFVAATITGTVYRLRDNRLTVTVADNGLTHRDRIAITLAEGAQVKLESADYRRAEPGDRVVSLRAAVLDSGDQVVQQITIEKQSRRGEATDAEASLVAKYRHLSDEPGTIRQERSRHFLLHTDISPRSAAILLEKLEAMIELVTGYYGKPATQIIECYVVRDITQWPTGLFDATAIELIRTGAGVTQTRSLGRQVKSIVYACDDHGTVQHEAVHAYCSQTFGDVGPVWYAEGMAEMGNYWQSDEPAVSIPAVAVHYLRTSPPKTMAEIVAAGQITGDSWQAYQWRWALCYLLANNPNYARHFKALGIGLMTGAPGASFEAVYGPVAPRIAFEYQQFLKHLDNGYRVDLAAWQWDRPGVPLQSARRVTAKIAANRGWQPTGAALEQGTTYDFAAQGQWGTRGEQLPVDADGDADGTGRLIGAILHDSQLGEPFDLGIRGSFVAKESGDLYVRCRDAWNALADNDGQITLHLRKAPGGE